MTRPRYVMDFERPLVELECKLDELRRSELAETPELASEIDSLAREIEAMRVDTYRNLTPWDRVQIARHPERPKTQHYVSALFTDVVELHGDRVFGDDSAIVAGLATIQGHRVVFVGHRKGSNTNENIERHFGSPTPEGFRKAMRVMRLAQKFSLPLVTFLDTPGAYAGPEAEERGQAWAIADSLSLLSELRVPVVCIGVGEGGSGGALGIGFGDRLFVLENAYYSVSTPEACASIIYRDTAQAKNAASSLKLTADDVFGFGIADKVLPEPLGGAHRDPEATYETVGGAVAKALDELAEVSTDTLVEERYAKLRSIGVVCHVP